MSSLDQLLAAAIDIKVCASDNADKQKLNFSGNVIAPQLRRTIFRNYGKKRSLNTSRRINPTVTAPHQDPLIILTLTLNNDDSLAVQITILHEPNKLQLPPSPQTPSATTTASDPFPFALLAHHAKSYRRTVFKPQQSTRKHLLNERNASILAQHAHSRKEYKEAKAREHRQRMNALKADNVEEYLKLIADSKNSKIQTLLKQTDECLRKLAARLNCPIVTAVTDQQDEQKSNDDDAENTTNNNIPPPPPPISTNTKTSKLADQIKASNSMWNKLSFQTFANIQHQPSLLVGGQLRPYQMQGLQWLAGLKNKGLNGILADEMGLGKTIQVIALICHIKEESIANSDDALPFLIAMPASVLPNWKKEFAHWAPSLKVVSYNGSQDNRQNVYEQYLSIRTKRGKNNSRTDNDDGRADVCLTTYELLMSNKEGKRSPLSRLQWSYVIVDEAHRLKNHNCKLNREMRQHYSSQHRLLLTGTPLSNSLEELWSLLNFLMPDLFNSTDDFQTWFGKSGNDDNNTISNATAAATSNDDDDDEDVAMLNQEEALLVTKRLHQVLRPFMLRRMKESVAGELEKYEERMIACQPSPYQKALFSMLQQQLVVVGKKEDTSNGGEMGLEKKKGNKRATPTAPPPAITSVRVNNIMMEMRNISNHPSLSKLHPQGAEHIHLPLSHPLPHDLRLCSKLELLDHLLIKLYAAKHKVLIFSTMTRALDIIEDHLAWRGFPCSRLDGATPTHERGDIVNQFNNTGNNSDSSFAFLLSFRAGGVGLNLQAADTIIMYDPEWNPQIDAQAIARCHRIGQHKKVLVLRLLTMGTVEEKVFKVAGEKKGLAEASITAGFFDGATSAAEREKYLLNLMIGQQQEPGLVGGGGKEQGGCGPSSSRNPGSSSSSPAPLTKQDINKLLARTDEELALFTAEDATLESNEVAAWKHATMNTQQQQLKSSGSYSRLATAEDIAGLVQYAQQMTAPKQEERLEDLGRGKRARLGAGAMKEPTGAIGGGGSKVKSKNKVTVAKKESPTVIDSTGSEEKKEELKKESSVVQCTEEECHEDLKTSPPPPPQPPQQVQKKSERLALKRNNKELSSSQGGDKKQKTA